jgi:hypothetical protein
MKETSYLAVTDDGISTVPVGQSFTYNINSSNAAEVGAMTLFMNYDANKFEIENVATSLEGMKYVVKDGQINLAWSNTQPLNVNANEPVLSLQMKVKEAIAEPTQIFSVNSGSEFADGSAVRFDNFDLKMASVVTPTGGNDFFIYNFPNPFQNSTDIFYSLPEQAHVKLTITNMFGAVIATLAETDQMAGSYKVKVNPTDLNLKPGVYLYHIQVDGVTTSYNKTGKMVFNR